MKIRELLVAVAMALPMFAHGQIAVPQVVGPEYPIAQQKPDYEWKANTYCGGYFTLEAKTQYGGPYLAFYYRGDKNALESDEVPLNDVSLAVIPDSTNGMAGAPKAVFVGQDGGQKVWVIDVTDKMLQDYMPCLKDVPRKSNP